MPKTNKHGLSRDIPADVKRAVRARCGFGCIICGDAIVDYEHFDPEFVDAKQHDPLGIILLCPKHHRAKGSFLSRDRIRQAMEAPHCIQKGTAWSDLDFSSYTVRTGPFTSANCATALQIRDERIAWLSQPEAEGAPVLLNLRLYSKDGLGLVTIEDNVWKVSKKAKDVQLRAGKDFGHIEVRDTSGVIFKSRLDAPNTFIIDTYRGWCKGRFWEISTDHKGGGHAVVDGMTVMSGHFIIDGFSTAVQFS